MTDRIRSSSQLPSGVTFEPLPATSSKSGVNEAAAKPAPLDGMLAPLPGRAVSAAALNPPSSPEDWANGLDFTSGYHPFMKGFSPSWTKFTLAADAPNKVFFQNANAYDFHYDFAHKFLEPFKNMSRSEFDAVSLGQPGQPQQAVLGALLQGPNQEFGVQITSAQPLTAQQVLDLLNTVKGNLHLPPEAKLFYFPTTEQQSVAQTYAPQLAAAGFPVGSMDRWQQADQTYSSGWAMGRAKYVPANEIEEKYASGELMPTDILVTDGVPSEVPFVAGIISLAPATPNSHVAILASSYGVPFAYLNDPAQQEAVRALDGQDISFRANEELDASSVDVEPLGTLTEEQRAQVLAFKKTPPLEITPKELLGKVGDTVEALGPDTMQFVGGKASNYALLLRALPPENVRPAVAFSFDVEARLMAQPVKSSKNPGQTVTLQEEIHDRLSAYNTYPVQDLPGLRATLEGIRTLIIGTPFPDDLKQEIQDVLLGPGGHSNPRFNPNRSQRFRSSSNVEDGATFTGAGLHDSFSGTLAIDLGTKQPGPGHRRGVYEAMHLTLASFFNENAYLERLRHGVDPTKSGMALLSHEASPGAEEKANGVATVSVSDHSMSMKVVSQVDDEEIANPEPGAPKPEVMTVNASRQGPGTYVGLEQASTHPKLRLGEQVLGDNAHYEKLGDLLRRACEEYLSARGVKPPAKFDLEYELIAPPPGQTGEPQLKVKQIRPVPTVTGNVPALLAPGELKLRTDQEEFGDVFQNHAQKTRMTVDTPGRWLSGPNADLGAGFFENIEMEYVEDGVVKKVSGPFDQLAGFQHDATPQDGRVNVEERWNGDRGTNHFTSDLAEEQTALSGPLLSLKSVNTMRLRTELKKPITVIDFDWSTNQLKQKQLTEATASLHVPGPVDTVVQNKSYSAPGAGKNGADVKIDTAYRFEEASGPFMKTAKLGEWEGTTISGLTTQPIQLQDFFSQTFRPAHHNFAEELIFEPRLEPGIPPEQVAELEAQNIRQLYVDQSQKIHVSGKDGVWREL